MLAVGAQVRPPSSLVASSSSATMHAIACFALCLLASASAASLPRGVDPAKAGAYQPKDGQFTCLDGSKTIPFSQVNDNYCDCPGDGSDEPGTSACYYGTFYCQNRGHHPQTLSASFVDDGICDCCDGSDESKVACKHTCLDKGAAERQSVRDKVELMRKNLDNKQHLIAAGQQKKASWASRSALVGTELAAAEEEVANLDKKLAERQAAADADRQRIAAEQQAAFEADAARQAEAAQQAAASTEQAPVEEHPQEGHAEGAAHEETDEERGRRIASQWTNDPAAAAADTHAQGEGEGVGEPGDDDDEEGGEQPEDYPGDEADSETGGDSSTGGTPVRRKKRPETYQEFFSRLVAEQAEYWRREWEDAKAFGNVLRLAWQQLQEGFDAFRTGGMRELARRREVKEQQEREAKAAKVQAELMAQLNALEAPWRKGADSGDASGGEAGAGAGAGGQQGSQAASQQQAGAGEQQQPDVENMTPAAQRVRKRREEARRQREQQQQQGKRRQQGKRKAKSKRKSQAAAPAEPEPEGWIPPPEPSVVDASSVYSPLDDEVAEVRRQLSVARSKVDGLKQEAAEIQTYHASGAAWDFGPDNMYASLAGRCISDYGQRWTYEACFFSAATQKEPHNPSNAVRLGTWKGFANDYTEAVFDNGDPCAGAPNRSLTVRLTCGEDERMWGGEEPATCVYTVWFATPLACRQADLQQELDKLAELERWEAQVKAEIEAEQQAKAKSAPTQPGSQSEQPLAGMGGGHHHVPTGPEPPYAKILANKSELCPPSFHYRRETWYPHGGFYCDPKGWRRNTAFAVAGVAFIMYSVFEWSKTNEVRYRAPKIWIPSLLWNDKVPDPVDFRGRTLDRVTGLPKDGAAAH